MTSLSHATAAADACMALTSIEDKKRWGQFFTPPEVASFMGAMLRTSGSGPMRVLDPGAGVGILGLAAARSLLAAGSSSVHLVAVEAHPPAMERLRGLLDQEAAASSGRLAVTCLAADFLDLGQSRLGIPTLPPFDCVIANPPYFKMSPSDLHGGDEPNIYARFMEIGARLLKRGGQLVFIVPRSFASGLYFKRFRKDFHERMALTRIHVFESRREAFKDQGVLQENIIVRYTKTEQRPATVLVSSSGGASDLDERTEHEVSYTDLIQPGDSHGILHLPATPADVNLLKTVRQWRSSLHGYNLEISTGPVVPFRATSEIVDRPNGAPVVPLLWMQHVKPEGVTWPLGENFRKHEYILASASDKLLVPNRTYVLLRRFSAKEEERRLTATVLRHGALPGASIGLENHVNYIHRPGGEFDESEATGLAALLNSELLDGYFRIVNGNTQVNATEIRAMPLPSRDLTIEIGRRMDRAPNRPGADVVREVLGV